jgi:hypothetical protein
MRGKIQGAPYPDVAPSRHHPQLKPLPAETNKNTKTEAILIPSPDNPRPTNSRIQMTLKASNQMIPPDSAEVILIDIVETDSPERTPGRGHADASTRRRVRVADEGLAVGCERVGLLGVLRRHVVAGVQGVDLVCAVARRVGAGAD